MAASTTVLNAKDARITLDGHDISGTANQVELSMEFAVGEFYVFDDDWRQVLGGKRQWNVTIQVAYSETDDEGMDVLYDAWLARTPRPIEIMANTAGVGDWQWTGEVLVPNPNIPLTADDANPILVSVDCPANGELTRTTLAS